MAINRMILLASAALLAAPAGAQMVTAKDPQVIAAFLKEKGYKAELTRKPEGPNIRSSDSGISFTIFFMNCSSGKDCSTIQFFNGYSDIDNVPLTRINEWNKTHRFARAYIDDAQDPVLEMDMDLDNGGVPKASFAENFDIWLDLVAAYRKFLTEQGGGKK
jgi:hypothetical protein